MDIIQLQIEHRLRCVMPGLSLMVQHVNLVKPEGITQQERISAFNVLLALIRMQSGKHNAKGVQLAHFITKLKWIIASGVQMDTPRQALDQRVVSHARLDSIGL